MSGQPTEYGKELIAVGVAAFEEGGDLDLDEMNPYYEQHLSEAVRRILLAFCAKEPSEAMADKGESSLICGPEPKDIEGSPSMSWAHAKSCFRAMIAQLGIELGIDHGEK